MVVGTVSQNLTGYCLLTILIRYQQILHRNIVYLGTIADASPETSLPSNVKIIHTHNLRETANNGVFPYAALFVHSVHLMNPHRLRMDTEGRDSGSYYVHWNSIFN